MIDHYTRLKGNDVLEWVYVYEEDVEWRTLSLHERHFLILSSLLSWALALRQKEPCFNLSGLIMHVIMCSKDVQGNNKEKT